jgi:UDP-GlcNAc:undecaprenyl-phosphate GlcNAc-1-phosphate transferase
MLNGIVAFAVGLLANLLLTPLAGSLAKKWNLVDQPDARRKLHGRSIPVAGGLAVLLSVALAVAALSLLAPESGLNEPWLLSLGAAGLLICLIGVADDYRLLRGRHKIVGQLLVITLLIAHGVQIERVHLFGYDLELGVAGVAFTVFFLMGAINSLNLLDGMDGLLGSTGLILSLALACMSLHGGHMDTACLALALGGALLGFLAYNFPPASIFLGDSGSMLIGLVVGVLAIRSSFKGPATVSLMAPAALLTIPILDTLTAIVRRKLTGRSLFDTDRGHIHHCLLRQGWSPRKTLLIISSLCLLAAVGALGSVAFNSEFVALVTAATVIGILVSARLFGYAELALVGKRLGGFLGSFVRLPAEQNAREFEVQLQGKMDWNQLWCAVVVSARKLNLVSARLDINAPSLHESYHARWDRPAQDGHELENRWRTELPIVAHGQVLGRILVVGAQDDVPAWQKIKLLARLSEELEASAAQLTAPALPLPSTHVLSAPHVLESEPIGVRIAEQT